MGELGGHLDLAEEAVVTQRMAELGPENLYRDRPAVPEVAGEKDHRHAASAELTLDSITAGKSGRETVQQIDHDRSTLP
jgi:hypothetical protein